MPKDNPLKYLSILSLDKLFYSNLDSFDSIPIITERNKIILNVSRPVVLRKYYGIDKLNLDPNVLSRAAYWYNSSSNPVGTDPKTYVTKPFDNNMANMTNHLDKLKHLNTYKLSYQDLDENNRFNRCTILYDHYHSSIKAN